MTILQLLAGLIYLLMGGDLLVRGAISLARRWQLSPALVGATIVAVGTSAPELFVSIQASVTGHGGIAIGNVVGSNIANLLLVVGALAVICPIHLRDEDGADGDAISMLVLTVLAIALAWNGTLSRFDGLILAVGLPAFAFYKFRHAAGTARALPPRADGRIDWVVGRPRKMWMIVLFLVVGSAWLPIGGYLLIDATESIARSLGVSEAIIGSTIIAVGTSLPELATVIIAAARREVDVAFGNAVGSNVFNIVGVLAASAIVAPAGLGLPGSYRILDLPIMLGAAIVITYFVLTDRRMRRPTGLTLLGIYAAYVIALYTIG